MSWKRPVDSESRSAACARASRDPPSRERRRRAARPFTTAQPDGILAGCDANEFVGLDHPAGELRLELRRRGRFRLTLAIWDPVVGAVAGRRELSGRWRSEGEQLELRAPARRIHYRVDVSGTLVWQRSNLPTFADGIALRPTAP